MHGMIWHAAVDEMLDCAGAFCGVGQCAAYYDFVASLGDCVDECELGALEDFVHERRVVHEVASEKGDVGQACELLRNHAFEGMGVGADAIP